MVTYNKKSTFLILLFIGIDKNSGQPSKYMIAKVAYFLGYTQLSNNFISTAQKIQFFKIYNICT